MRTRSRTIFVGVAWPYVNDIFHIGNLAGAYLPPDIFARYHRLRGNRVLMVSGSDWYGTPITVRADEEGKRPEEVAKRFHKLDKQHLKNFNISYDLYTATNTPNHRHVVQKMFLKLLKRGYITVATTQQLYSPTLMRFLQDRYIEGECPYCHFKEARGDQCERCGRVLDALELLRPHSKLDKRPLVPRPTENYFLDLSKLENKIGRWLKSRHGWRKWVLQEALGWVKEGLRPRAITRDMDYGVPLPISRIPKDKRIRNIEHKVFYVWFEAVIGYLSAAIEYAKRQRRPALWRDFLYNPRAENYYFVGQDNLVFHTINWPAQLMGYDPKINLPTNVFVNKFLLLEGQKMSKSRGWFIDTPYLVKHYHVDAVRFYLASRLPENKEADFKWREFADINNNVLVANIGNFIHRVLTFGLKHFKGNFDFSSFTPQPKVRSRIERTFRESGRLLEGGRFQEALNTIVALASFGNQYLTRSEVWKIIEKDREKARRTLQNALLIIDALHILLYPFIPASTEKLGMLLGRPIAWRGGESQWRFSPPARSLRVRKNIRPLFNKIEAAQVQKELAKLKAAR